MRILIVDDHELVRRGVQSLLLTQPDIEVCGEAVDGQDAIEQSRQLNPDLIVMDISMPRLNGLEATREIRRILPNAGVLVLTQHDSPEMMQQALIAGARGYVVKSEISEHLVAGIQKVYRGQLFFSAAVLGHKSNLDLQEILQRSEAFEKALRDSEERFRLTFEHAAVGIAHVAEDGHFLRANQKICDISGYTETELLRMRFQDITHPDDLAADLAQAERVTAGEIDQYSMEKRYIRKDKSIVWVNLTVSAVRGAENNLTYFVAVVQDINERKSAEDRLRESDERFRQTFEQAAVGIAHIAQDGRWLRVNQKLCQILGYTTEELLKGTFQAITHPDDLIEILAKVEKIVKGELDQFAVEKRSICKDGSFLWVNLTLSAVRDSARQVKYFVAVIEDISVRKDAQEQLSVLLDYQTATMNNLAEGLFTLDEDGLATSINAAAEAMFGWTAAELLGKKMHDVIHYKRPDGRPFPASDCPGLHVLQDGGQLREHEDVFIRKDGSFMPVVFSASSLYRDGRVAGLVVGFRDDTDSRRVRNQLRDSEQRLRELIDALPAAIYTTDAEGLLTHFNSGAVELSGCTPALCKDRWCMSWNMYRADGSPFPPEECPMKIALTEGRIVEQDVIVERPDGTRRWCTLFPRLFRDRDGKITGGLSMAVDITEQMTAKRELSDTVQQQKALFRFSDQLHRAVSLEQACGSAVDAILAALSCGRASVLLCDEQGMMRFVSWRGLSANYRATVEGHSAWAPRETNFLPVCVPDVDNTEMADSLRGALKAEGIGALAFIPLVSNGKLIGKFMTYFNTAHQFSEDEINLSLTISRQLAFGIDRLRAEDSLRKGANALANLNDLGARLWRIRNLKHGLDEILTSAMDLLGAAKGHVQLLGRVKGSLVIAAQRGFDQEFLDFFREVSLDHDTACGRALRLREPVVIEDVETDAPYAPFRAAARAAGYRAVISVPAIGAEGTPMGLISMHFRSVHRPTALDLRQLDLCAHQAADFIHRCKTEEALRKSEKRLLGVTENLEAQVRARTAELELRSAQVLEQSEHVRDLSALLLQAQDNERRRVARELHDSAGQILTVLNLNLATFVRLASQNPRPDINIITDSQGLVQQLIRETRTMSYLLHPPMLEERGLAEALRWYVRGLGERSPVQIDLEIPIDFKRLAPVLELVMFRVVQEALTNIHRHSRSKTAKIRLAQSDTTVAVEIEDRGQGISAEKLMEIQSHGSGVGVRGMRERVRLVKGEMKIESNRKGTKISVVFPVSAGSFVEEAGELQPS
ncbi:MAG TPA: PAS domain S-box protein [Terriglobia bacterium]|nr:PAS domain S-box protein [Terriglobia bacterium]